MVVSYDGLHYYYYGYQHFQALFYLLSGIWQTFDVSCDEHMVYEYSFIVDLDFLSPLEHSVFQFQTQVLDILVSSSSSCWMPYKNGIVLLSEI